MAAGDFVNVTLSATNSPEVLITITDNGDGTFSFQITQQVGVGNYLGDIRGIFFDIGNDALVAGAGTQVSVSDVEAFNSHDASGVPALTATSALQDGNDSVSNLGNGNNMNGALAYDDVGTEANGWDVGIGFGTAGVGTDDVGSVTFTLSLAGLTINDLANMDIGLRMTSVGQDTDGDGDIDTARDGEFKLTGETSDVQSAAEVCFDGLSHGAWKTPDSGAGIWDDGYATGDSFEATFGINVADWDPPPATPGTVADVTLLEALSLTGGDQYALAREAVAALLNAADSASGDPELVAQYAFTGAEVVAAVKWVFGLDSDVDQDGDVDANAAADNVYQAGLGSDLQILLEQWNTVHDNPAYVAGEGLCFAPADAPDILFVELGWTL